MDKIKKWLRDERVKGAIAILAAVVMYYTLSYRNFTWGLWYPQFRNKG